MTIQKPYVLAQEPEYSAHWETSPSQLCVFHWSLSQVRKGHLALPCPALPCPIPPCPALPCPPEAPHVAVLVGEVAARLAAAVLEVCEAAAVEQRGPVATPRALEGLHEAAVEAVVARAEAAALAHRRLPCAQDPRGACDVRSDRAVPSPGDSRRLLRSGGPRAGRSASAPPRLSPPARCPRRAGALCSRRWVSSLSGPFLCVARPSASSASPSCFLCSLWTPLHFQALHPQFVVVFTPHEKDLSSGNSRGGHGCSLPYVSSFFTQ